METSPPSNIADSNGDSVAKGRVAVVEDGEATRYYLLQNLKARGYTVKGIEDGASAIPLMRAFRPDVVLLDVSLPGINGFDICRLIRLDEALKDAVVILLTGLASPEDRQAGWSAGADDYLIKPCEIPEVLARIAAHIRYHEVPIQLWKNPISRLPAQAAIEERMSTLLDEGKTLGFCYIDIEHFKSYNDRYGYLSGDALLATFADLIRDVTNQIQEMQQRISGENWSFAGHLGSDDFVIITHPDLAQVASDTLKKRFSAQVPYVYRSIDRERGWVPGIDKNGTVVQYPFMSLATATTTHSSEALHKPYDQTIHEYAQLIWLELHHATRPRESA